MQILGRVIKRRRRPQKPLRRHLRPLSWPDLIRQVQETWRLSTHDLAILMGKSDATIRTYRSEKVGREPPESFKQAFYSLVKVLETAPAEVLLTLDGRAGIIKGKDETWHVVSLGTGVFLHECRECNEFFVAQHNALRCPICRKEF